jgi:hypothetical protein
MGDYILDETNLPRGIASLMIGHEIPGDHNSELDRVGQTGKRWYFQAQRPQGQVETFEPISYLPWKAGCSAQQRPLSHLVSLTACAECPVAADDQRSLVVLRYCFRFPGPRRLRGCWPQQQIADQAVSDSLLPPSNPHPRWPADWFESQRASSAARGRRRTD